jgi:hypothetical protein
MGCPALGQKRTSRQLERMSALPPIADIGTQSWNVRFVPIADVGGLKESPRTVKCLLLGHRALARTC